MSETLWTCEETSESLRDFVIKAGAFVTNKPVIVDEDLVIPDVPFSCLLTPKRTSPPPVSLMDPANTKTATAAGTTDSNNGNDGNTTSKCASQNGSRRSSCSIISANDDFLMVDLMKAPFAITNTNSDVAAFYLECQSAPQLQAYMEEKTLAEQLGDLTKQLETFEMNMMHYDDILSSLYCHSENNKLKSHGCSNTQLYSMSRRNEM